VVVASPAWLRAHGRPGHPRELSRANCVCVIPNTASQWMFRDNGRPLAVAVKGNIEFNHIAPAIETCAAGMGFGMFLSYQVLPLVAQGRLEIVLGDFEAPPRPVSVIYPHARLLPARTRAFIDWMKAEFSGLAL
jgi:DNA-binding transcriptional LysR family regulator